MSAALWMGCGKKSDSPEPTPAPATGSAPTKAAPAGSATAPAKQPEAKAPAAATKPFKIERGDGSGGKVDGMRGVDCKGPCVDLLFASSPSDLKVKLTGTTGTKVSVQGRNYTIADGGTIATIDLAYEPLARNAASISGTSDMWVDVPIGITEPGGARREEKLELDVANQFIALLGGIKNGPVKFAVEIDKPKYPKDAAFEMFEGGNGGTFVGDENARIIDIDTVIFTVATKRIGGSCNYVDDKGGKHVKKKIFHDRVATVYDRKTGKKVATRTFAAKNVPCPKEILENDLIAEGYEEEAYTKWVATFASARPKDAPPELDIPPRPAPQLISIADAKPLPPLAKIREAFYKAVPEEKIEGIDSKAPIEANQGIEFYSGLGQFPGSKEHIDFKALSFAKVGTVKEYPPVVGYSTKSLFVVGGVVALDTLSALARQLTDRSPTEVVQIMKEDGWKEVTEPSPVVAGLQDDSISGKRGEDTVNVSLYTFTGIEASTAAIHLGKDGFVYVDAGNKEASKKLLAQIVK